MSESRLLVSIGDSLIRRAKVRGNPFDSFIAEYIRFCTDTNSSPTTLPHILLQLADVDRYCGNKHGPKELQVEQQAYIRHRNENKKEGNGNAIRQT